MFPPYNSTLVVRDDVIEKAGPDLDEGRRPGQRGPDRRGHAGAERPRRPRQGDPEGRRGPVPGGDRTGRGLARARTPGRMESVWDYPRPPAVEPSTRRARVVHGGVTVAALDRARCACSRRASRRGSTSRPTMCASTCSIRTRAARSASGRARRATGRCTGAQAAAWSYPAPMPGLRRASWTGLAFYPQRVDACFLDDEERVQACSGTRAQLLTAAGSPRRHPRAVQRRSGHGRLVGAPGLRRRARLGLDLARHPGVEALEVLACPRSGCTRSAPR